MTHTIRTPFGTTLSHHLDTLLAKRNRLLTLEYWTSRDYKLHKRITERGFMHSHYRTQRSLSLGMVINCLLYRMRDTSNLLIKR